MRAKVLFNFNEIHLDLTDFKLQIDMKVVFIRIP